jgi:hypothetical protein
MTATTTSPHGLEEDAGSDRDDPGVGAEGSYRHDRALQPERPVAVTILQDVAHFVGGDGERRHRPRLGDPLRQAYGLRSRVVVIRELALHGLQHDAGAAAGKELPRGVQPGRARGSCHAVGLAKRRPDPGAGREAETDRDEREQNIVERGHTRLPSPPDLH